MVYVVHGQTESGDELQPLVWKDRPTIPMIEGALRRMYPIEYEQVGFVNWELVQGAEMD